jgi:uncharacterized protein (DUF486 family)
MRTIVLLTISNIFMTLAWYGHLKYKDTPLSLAILASWGIAFIEYCFQVPANRIGHQDFSAAQLKTIQEVITLAVFLRLFRSLPSRAAQMELHPWLWDDGWGCLRDFQRVVNTILSRQRDKLSWLRTRKPSVLGDLARETTIVCNRLPVA